jgi:guanine deaminase
MLDSKVLLMKKVDLCLLLTPILTFKGLGTGVPLLQWLEKFTFNYESQFKELDFARKVYPNVVDRLLKNGSTTVSYFATIHLEATKYLHDLCVNAGQRALIGKVCMDRNGADHYVEPSAQQSLADTESLIEYSKAKGSALVKPTITPRFAITCTTDLLRGLGDLAKKHDCHVQSHLDENKGEIAFTGELFPGKTYTEVYKSTGLLTKKTVMAHCVYTDHHDLALLKESGTGIAHCPTSNFSMFSGLCNVRRALDAGVHVGLGTDVAGGFSPSILSTIRDALHTASAIQTRASDPQDANAGLTFDEAFFLATLGGAQALNLQDVIGNFLPGKAFDALVINPTVANSPIDLIGNETARNLLEKFIFNGDDRNIEHVFVQGARVQGHAHANEFFTQ